MTKEREEFEAWAKDHCLTLGLDRDGCYAWSVTSWAWEGWQAARASLQPNAAAALASVQPDELAALQERYDFVLSACRDAQETASRYGWALHAIAFHANADAVATASAALGGASPLPVELSDERIEQLAVKHEAFGFGRADERGLTTHGFDPDGLRAFARAVLREARKESQS